MSRIRFALIAASFAVLAGGPVLAQSTATTSTAPMSATTTDAKEDARPSSTVPVDHGPFTAEASRAYQGGGMVLQAPPGSPAPVPEATPPGQTPRNMVPAN